MADNLDAALAYRRAGLCPIPIRGDGSKRPTVAWEPFQSRLPSEDEIIGWFGDESLGVAIVGGTVSNNLECIDFDHEAESIFPAWRASIEKGSPGLFERLNVVKTPKGYHVRYRFAGDVPGNHKLAMRNRQVLIETRGEGGYALAPGCPPSCHPSGLIYSWFSGPRLSRIETITSEERDVLVCAAREFGEAFEDLDRFNEDFSPSKYPVEWRKVIEDYNARGPSFAELMTPAGWTLIREKGGQQFLRRPGKKDRSSSASTFAAQDGTELLKVWSPNAHPFIENKVYNRFSVFAILRHGGQTNEAARILSESEYGKAPVPQKKDKPVAAAGELACVRLSTVKPKPVRYLVEGYIPLGKTCLLAGDGGFGKSTITLDLAACLTTGRPALGLGDMRKKPSDVLLISCEDDPADTIVPRLLTAGADLDRVHHVRGIMTRDGKTAPFSLAHYESMAMTLRKNSEIRLVVIDPAGAYIGRTGVDDHKDSDLRALLQPLADLSATHEVTILLVKHVIKGATSKAVHKVSGSAGYVNAVRAAFMVGDDTKTNQRLFLPVKANLGPKPKPIAYEMKGLSVDEQKQILMHYAADLAEEDQLTLGEQLFRIHWKGQVDVNPDEVICREGEGRPAHRPPEEIERAKVWLRHWLADGPKRVQVTRMEAGNFESISVSTMYRAARELGVVESREGNRLWWTLPVSEQPTCPEVGFSETNGHPLNDWE